MANFRQWESDVVEAWRACRALNGKWSGKADQLKIDNVRMEKEAQMRSQSLTRQAHGPCHIQGWVLPFNGTSQISVVSVEKLNVKRDVRESKKRGFFFQGAGKFSSFLIKHYLLYFIFRHKEGYAMSPCRSSCILPFGL